MQILSNPISALNVCESPKFKFSHLKGNRGRGTQWWHQILDQKWKYGHFAHTQWKISNISLIYGRIAKIFASFRKSGLRNMMVTSDFSPEVEIRPFRACAMHPAIIIWTVRSLWTWLWGRYHVPQNAFLVRHNVIMKSRIKKSSTLSCYSESSWLFCSSLLTAVSSVCFDT